MLTTAFIFLAFVILWSLAAARASGLLWMATTGAALAVWTALCPHENTLRNLLWGAFLLLFLPFQIPPIRRNWITRPLLSLFRNKVPHMSQTEREALEAGTVWWDAELFSGRPDWEKLLSFPAPRLTEEEAAFLEGPVEELCRMIDDWKINEVIHDLPPEVWSFLKSRGFFGMIIPKKYGGLQFSALAHSSVIMKISSRSLSVGVTTMVPNSLGPAEILLHYGTEEQKDYYLPRLAKGEEIPCFALTSTTAGSDAASIKDFGVVCRGEFEGKKDCLGIRLNWEKRYITLGPVATLIGLAFKLYDPDHLIGEKEEIGITVALIPARLPGITIGNRHVPMNLTFQNGPNFGRDVFIPIDYIVGGVKRAGQGWRMLMECLAAGRAISLPALSTGAGKLASRATGAYAAIRKQFKTPIGHFEGIEDPLARIGGMTYLMDAARIMTLGAVDSGEKPSVISAMIKYHLTELMRRVVNDAMDIQGGSGICLGPRNFMGRVYQGIPISITVEGANILTRNLIIFGQGAIRCHPYILKELEATLDPDPARAATNFDQAFFSHIRYTLSNAARALFHGVTGSRLASAPSGRPLGNYYCMLTRLSAGFALTADLSMILLGGSLKFREKLSARLGDILSYLYISSAILKRYEDEGREEDDLPLVLWSLEYSLHQIQQRFLEVIKNFPNRLVAGILKWILFPDGRPFKMPVDRLGHRIARILLKPGTTRDRLTRGIYIPKSPEDSIGRLEFALDRIRAAEKAERKVAEALRDKVVRPGPDDAVWAEALGKGIISSEESELLGSAAAARLEAVTVDNFPPDFWKNRTSA
jgi:acyl-CoA dehydrogenase